MTNIINRIMNNIFNYFNYSNNCNQNDKEIEKNFKLMFCNCEKNNIKKNNNLFKNIINDFEEIDLYIDNNLLI